MFPIGSKVVCINNKPSDRLGGAKGLIISIKLCNILKVGQIYTVCGQDYIGASDGIYLSEIPHTFEYIVPGIPVSFNSSRFRRVDGIVNQIIKKEKITERV